MRKLILSMQMTLDGYVAGPNGEMDWIKAGEEEWTEMFNVLQNVDIMLLGRKMYPEYSTYWRTVLADPNSSGGEKEFAVLADRTPHIVFSRTMVTTDWHNTRIASDAASEVARLKQEHGKDMIMWGGATLARDLVNKGLVDELRITLNPTLLGSGLSLFNGINSRHRLTLVSVKPFKSGNVLLHYKS